MANTALDDFRKHFKLKLQKINELCDETKEQQLKLSEVIESTKSTAIGKQCKTLFDEINKICTLRKQSVQNYGQLIESFIKEQESHEKTIKNTSVLINIILNSDSDSDTTTTQHLEDCVEDETTVEETEEHVPDDDSSPEIEEITDSNDVKVSKLKQKNQQKKTKRKEKDSSEKKKNFRITNQFFAFRSATKEIMEEYIKTVNLTNRKEKSAFIGKFWNSFQNDDSLSDMYSWFNAQYNDIKEKVEKIDEENKKIESEKMFKKMYSEFKTEIADDLLSESWISDNNFSDKLDSMIQECK